MTRLVVTVICTDRGQHRSRRLWELVDCRQEPIYSQGRWWGGFVSSDRAVPKKPPPGSRRPTPSYLPDGEGLGENNEHGHLFICPGCGRRPQLRHERLAMAVDGLHAATRRNRVVLDVSLLPF